MEKFKMNEKLKDITIDSDFNSGRIDVTEDKLIHGSPFDEIRNTNLEIEKLEEEIKKENDLLRDYKTNLNNLEKERKENDSVLLINRIEDKKNQIENLRTKIIEKEQIIRSKEKFIGESRTSRN